MGAKVSVCNLTAIVINVALKHLGPVHFTNQIMPKTCAEFKTGQVWFTVEARVWSNGTNNYTNAQMGLPIAGLGLGTSALAGLVGSLVSVEGNSALTPSQKSVVREGLAFSRTMPFIPAVAAGAAAAFVNEKDRPDARLVARKLGVYMTDKKIINIRGGPKVDHNSIIFDEHQRLAGQTIDLTQRFPPMMIEESDKKSKSEKKVRTD